MEDYKLNKVDDKVISITCNKCGMTSYSPGDIQHKYCGKCHKFHKG